MKYILRIMLLILFGSGIAALAVGPGSIYATGGLVASGGVGAALFYVHCLGMALILASIVLGVVSISQIRMLRQKS